MRIKLGIKEETMSLINLLIVLVVIGVVVWAVCAYIPMEPGIKTLIRIVGVLVAVLYVLSAFGILGGFTGLQVPRIRG
jgi:hypothetical protein